MRTVEEWIGKTDDSRIPKSVRVRVFQRYSGRCHWSGRDIGPSDLWDVDHVVALCNGGEHRESNLAPILRDRHKLKTAQDRRVKAKTDRIRKRHLGIRKPSRFPGSRNSRWKRKIDGSVVER